MPIAFSKEEAKVKIERYKPGRFNGYACDSNETRGFSIFLRPQAQ